MNLKNITKVGFIANFNPRKSYPEFHNSVMPVKKVVKEKEIVAIKPKQVKVTKGGNTEIKNARKDPKNPRRKSWTTLVKSSVI